MSSLKSPGAMAYESEAVPYPGYPSNFWYPPSHSASPYSNAYPAGSEVNGHAAYNPQAIPGYPNGVYSPAQYPSPLHPTNPFYCGDAPPGQPPYPSQGCPEPRTTGPGGHPVHHPRYPVQHCQGGPGYPTGPYHHYGDGVHPMPQNHAYPTQPGLHSRPPAEAWSHTGGYGPPPPPPQQQQWPQGPQPPPSHYGNPFLSPQPPSWPGPGPTAPQYDPQDPQYAGYPHPKRPPQPTGPKPRPPHPSPGQAGEYSAPPQLYVKTGKAQDPTPSQGEPPPLPQGPTGPPLSDNPSLAHVQQVLARVELLQEDVDVFVGYKTDKSYRYLEELLTKELLELDSVETKGQEAVRQARKEAVQKVQGILDRLERKAF
ncbi:BAG family molecular chaperone regulator 4 [Amia ocellicauda]|uniref:BAG family molecular chaperone regulator 4 n=1 Tax=Amia ocellicauda TaxID=2972642 RepID=UPI0034642BA7